MRRILIVGGRIEPSPSANSVCVINVLNELAQMGYECHFLGLGDEAKEYSNDTVNFHLMANEKRKQSRLVRTLTLFPLSRLPETEPKVTNKKTVVAKSLHKKYNFDVVIGVCSSYSNIYTVTEIKKEHPNVKIGGYYLDTLESLSQLKGIARKIRDYYSYKGEYELFRKLDFILLPVASSIIYDNPKYINFRNKIVYTEFPTFVPKHPEDSNNLKNDNVIHAIIIGTLNKVYRNPSLLFLALKKVCDANNILLHIDIYGASEQDLLTTLDQAKCVSYTLHGRVQHNEIEKAIKRSDLVINISNSGILAVPSKIFEFFSSYKPMLSQVTDRDDSSIIYYDKYPCCFKYCLYEEEESQLNGLKEFLRNAKTTVVNKEEVDFLFVKNTPEFVAKQIQHVLYKML